MNKKILGSLLAIGVIAAVAGGSTFALFNDTESSSGNTFAAGELDLKVDWNESYNGEHVETQEFTDNPGPIFNINDVKPGDHGEATVSLHVFSNPAWVDMNFTQTGNFENGCSEPEADVDNTCNDPGTGQGELGEHLNFMVWNDDGDNVYQSDEEVYFNGTGDELSQRRTVWLDGDADTEGIQAFDNSTTEYVGIKWSVPRDTGNEIQTDSKRFNFTFWATQERHNPMGKMNMTPGNQTEPPEDNDTDDNETPGNQTEPPVDNNDTNVTIPNGTDNDTNVTIPNATENETLAAISFVEFCINGTQGQGNTECPQNQKRLVKFEYNGDFSPEGGDPMNISINATDFKENDTNEPIKANWSSQQFIQSVFVKSATDVCEYVGGFNGTVKSCGPPPGQNGNPGQGQGPP